MLEVSEQLVKPYRILFFLFVGVVWQLAKIIVCYQEKHNTKTHML